MILTIRKFNISYYCSFSPKSLGVSMALCQNVVNPAGGIFLPSGENLKSSDFDDSKNF